MRKRYKDPQLQGMYETCYARGADDFMRRRGGSLQCAFMNGYRGRRPLPSYIVRGTFTWAAMMAGKDRRLDEDKGKIKPAEVIDQRLLNVR